MSCNCSKGTGCHEAGRCPHKKTPPRTRLLPFSFWVQNYAPIIPKFYWDIESQEERLRHICLELDRLRAYINYVFCELENLANELAEELENAQKLLETLTKRIAEAEKLAAELRQAVTEIEQEFTKLLAEFETVKKQAQAAQTTAQAADTKATQAAQTAQAAQTTAQAADGKATAAQATAAAAQTTAQAADTKATQAAQTAQAAEATAAAAASKTALDALATRVTELENCCKTVLDRLTALENFNTQQEQTNSEVQAALDALNVVTTENPDFSLSNFEAQGQISSGPIDNVNPAMYASVLAITCPLYISAPHFEIEKISVSARVGGFVAYQADDGTKKQLAGLDLVRDGQVVIPEVIGHYVQKVRGGLRIRFQFSKPLYREGQKPDGTYLSEPIMNGTPAAVSIWLKGKATD